MGSDPEASDPTAPAPAASSDGKAPAEPPACERAFLSLLVCPYTRTSLAYDREHQELVSRPEHLAFPIRDGVPILVREEARALDDAPSRPSPPAAP